MKQIENNKGRFVGLRFKDGSSYNAQILGSTDKYVTFRNTRTGEQIKRAKASLQSVNGQTVK